jgi:hypothetical protein
MLHFVFREQAAWLLRFWVLLATACGLLGVIAATGDDGRKSTAARRSAEGPPTLRVARDAPPLERVGERDDVESEPGSRDQQSANDAEDALPVEDDRPTQVDAAEHGELDPAALPDGPLDDDGWLPRAVINERLGAQPIGHSSRRRTMPLKRPRDPILDKEANQSTPELEPPIVDDESVESTPSTTDDPAPTPPVDDEGFNNVYDGRPPQSSRRNAEPAPRSTPSRLDPEPGSGARSRGKPVDPQSGRPRGLPNQQSPREVPSTPPTPSPRQQSGQVPPVSSSRLPQTTDPSGKPSMAQGNPSPEKAQSTPPAGGSIVPSVAPFDIALPRLEAPLPPTVQRLHAPIRSALAYHQARRENVAERTPWGVFHAMLPYRERTQLVAGRRVVNATSWLAGNQPMRGIRVMAVDKQGLFARQGIGMQGHQGQMLAIFAQTGVPADYPLYVGQKRFSVQDLIEREMADCKGNSELTFVLIGLAGYLPTNAQWQSSDGEAWDFERLLREELSQPIVGAACGGTHRLMGLTFALRQRRAEGLPITGQWERADEYIQDFIKYAFTLQNPDGSMSTSWFEGRADNGKLDRKLQTSGHIMEWLIYALPPERLTEDRVVRGVQFLTRCLWDQRSQKWEVGPKGHALRALALYQHRVFSASPDESPMASSRTATLPSRAPRHAPARPR